MFNKKNIITFFADEMTEGLPQPYPAYSHFPEWFVKSSKKSKCPFAPLMNLRSKTTKHPLQTGQNPYQITKDSTVQHCPGIVDYLKTGYIIPAWTDMVLRLINGEMHLESVVNFKDIDFNIHRQHQFQGMSFEQMPVMNSFNKVASPWWIKTTPGTSVLITHPYWNRNKTFTSVSAVVHPDSHPIHMKWFFEFNSPLKDSPEIYDQEFQVIKKGTPLMLIIPFKREKFTHECVFLNERDHARLHRDSAYGSVSWFSESPYALFRKKLGNLFR
jgi:hypothetical protein